MDITFKKNIKNSKPHQPDLRHTKISGGSAAGKRFVFIIGDEGAILIFMHGSKVVRRLFAPSAQPTHTEAIRDLISSNPRAPIYLLADVLDQQYIPHSFPPVSSLSVGSLVKRRLDRDFQPDDLKGSLPLGREKTGRKEWKFLLAALTKTALMGSWIDLLLQLPNELKGIYLVPIEAVNYLNTLHKKTAQGKPNPWQMLISYNKVSGLRQVIIHEGTLVFTRVSQVMDNAIQAVIAGNVEQEIINTLDYLKRLSFNENSELDATIVIAQDIGELIDLNRFGFGRATILSPQEVAETLKLEQAALSADRFGDVVMAAAFGITKKRTLRFSTAYMDKIATLYLAQKLIRASTALVFLILIGLSGQALLQMMDDYTARSKAEKQTTSIKPMLEKLQHTVTGLNQDLSFKSAVATTYDAFIQTDAPPTQFVTDFVPFVSKEHRIISMAWSQEASDKAPDPKQATSDATLPITVKIEFDLSGSGGTIPALNHAAKALLNELQTALPHYSISAAPFPWLKEEPKEEQITLEVTNSAALAAQNMILTVTFQSIKPVAATTPPTTQRSPQ